MRLIYSNQNEIIFLHKENCALQCSSNTAEYEAHLTGLAITHVINTIHLKIEDAQRHEDRYARGLETMCSQVINKKKKKNRCTHY
jgi:hypothetical protein